MYKDRRVAVVTPAYNEALHLSDVIDGMPGYVDHVIVVDDCSRDDTQQVLASIQKPSLVTLKTPSNQGVGGATLQGYARALELDCDIAVKMDGDGQMSPDHLSLLLDQIVDGGYDYAKGNRFLAGASLQSMPRTRLFGNIILTFLTKLASGYWHVFDPQNGYTAISCEALRRLDLAKIHRGYFFENDMLVALNFHNARVADVAIPAHYGDEQSKLSPLKSGITFPILLLARFCRRIYQKYVLRDFSPIALFLIVGLLLFAWGFLFGAYHWILSVVTQHVATTGTVMLAVLPLILGFQLMLQAIVLDIQETPR